MARKKQATLKYAWYEYTPEALQSGALSEKEIKEENSTLVNMLKDLDCSTEDTKNASSEFIRILEEV